ncbi:hypothetical protein ABEB36_014355 [Hypothenemus hampei]|uniref:Uncharacterized protein n=1 Tax=Hypothenemus hampei TaxID=57062 RepID=A0ABD1E4G1_HYPHA
MGLLSCSEKINEFPIVQSEAVEVVSNNITEIVYSKIVHSSKRSSTKTFNFLKFLNYICMKRQFHYGPKSYEIYIENYEKQLVKVEEILLLDKVKLELEDIPGVFYNKVTTFYEKRNSRRRDKLQTLIRLNQGKKLKNDSNLFPLNNISHYETSQSLIDSLFNKEQSKITGNIRKKTIRFGYALIRFSKDDYCLRILHTILQKLVSYGTLEEFENQFLLDVWTMKEMK